MFYLHFRIVTVKDPESVALYSVHGHPQKSHEFCVSGRDHYVRIYDQRKSDDPVQTFTPFSNVSIPFTQKNLMCLRPPDGNEKIYVDRRFNIL